MCLGLVVSLAVAGCASRTVVTRTDPSEKIDLSGSWNDSDSQQMAAALVTDMVGGPAWIERHIEATGARPAVIVGQIQNKTLEHIPMKTLVADLEASLINSGRATVVASAEEREGVRAEREQQQDFASPESVKRWGRERGADYMLLGELNAIVDSDEGEEVKYYQLDAYLVNLEDNTKVWTGGDRIKKFVARRAYKP
jgi:uncharacterized protein (TIGR02722 family)